MHHPVTHKIITIRIRRAAFAALCLMAAATASALLPVSAWIAGPLVIAALVGGLGFLLLVALKLRPHEPLDAILYAGGLGLSFVMIGGLAVNTLLPLLGIAQPLAAIPLMSFFDLSALALCAFILRRRDGELSVRLASPGLRSIAFAITPFVLVALSVAGAASLNNGGTGAITACMLALIALYALALVYMRSSMREWTYAIGLYAITLALLFMYSLRSGHILGWDINLEYRVFQMTLEHLQWQMSYYPGLDYNACLSITILPTIFAVLTHVPAEYVLKVIFQLIFAAVPVGVFALARRYLSPLHAFLAAFLLASQTWIYEQMPALIRQETAFVFYLALMLALLDTSLTRRARLTLFYAYTVALILSHYSTSYIWLTLLFGGLVLWQIVRFFSKSLRAAPVLISPLMLAFSLVLLFGWEAALTHTGSAIVSFTTNTDAPADATSSAPIKLPGVASTSATSSTATEPPPGILESALNSILFAGENTTLNIHNLAFGRQKAIDTYSGGSLKTYGDAGASGYEPLLIDPSTSVPSALPPLLSELVETLSRADKFLLIILFPLIGLACLLFSRKKGEHNGMDFVILNAGAYALMVLMTFIPYLQSYYNFTRLYLQMFLILSTLSVAGGVFLLRRLPRYRDAALTLMVVFLFCSLTGLLDHFTGGLARITLDQPPATNDSFYISDSEIAGARWLAQNREPNDPVQADIIANLRLQSFADLSANNSAIFPETIKRDSYVYLIEKNTRSAEAYLQYQNALLIYSYPTAFLNTHKALIYDNGYSRVYR